MINSETLPNSAVAAKAIIANQVGAAVVVPIAIECQPLKYVFQMALTPVGCSGSAPPEIAPRRNRDQKSERTIKKSDAAISGRFTRVTQFRLLDGVNKSSSSRFSSNIDEVLTSVTSAGKT